VPRGGWQGVKYATEAERFWAKVDQSGGPDACWPWTAATDRYGYGNFHVWRDGKKYMDKAHRVAYRLVHGIEPPAVLHSCDNPPCCNDAHLLSGTRKANNHDRHAKGRTACGEQKRHVLTEVQVRAIRARAAAGERVRGLAVEYGVTHTAISLLVRRRTWKHVE
jgi:hypothetical protein